MATQGLNWTNLEDLIVDPEGVHHVPAPVKLLSLLLFLSENRHVQSLSMSQMTLHSYNGPLGQVYL